MRELWNRIRGKAGSSRQQESLYGVIKKDREKDIEGQAWRVISRIGDGTCVVRVPMKKGGIRDVTFTFEPTDEFLNSWRSQYDMHRAGIGPIYVQPHNLIRSTKKSTDQGVTEKGDFKKDARELGITPQNLKHAQQLAANAFEREFWLRKQRLDEGGNSR